MCGGTKIIEITDNNHDGLSPRVRGNPEYEAHRLGVLRSIPACAGEPVQTPSSSATIKVYPRVCGGTTVVVGENVQTIGLSPRVRGNPGIRYNRRGRRRSIPACAGEPP